MKRSLARKGLALIGMALAVPSAVWGDTPESSAISKPWLNSSRPAAKSSSPQRPWRWFRAPGEVSQDDADKLVKQGVVPPAPGSQPAPAATTPAPAARTDAASDAALKTTSGPAPIAEASSSSPAPAPSPSPAATPAPAPRRWRMFRAPGEISPDETARLIKKGVVTPPPPTPPTMVAADGRRVEPSEDALIVPATPVADCKPCQEAQAAARPTITLNEDPTPGRASVGDLRPGHAAVGGLVPTAEPAPIGVVQGNWAQGPMMGQPAPPAAASRGAIDPSVLMSSYASRPMGDASHSNPHIVGHLTPLTVLGRKKAVERERRKHEDHASIPYLPLNQQTVTDLPSSMVYGRKAP